MRRLKFVGVALGCGVAVLATGPHGLSARAQTPPAKPAKVKAAAAEVPHGPGSVSGVWFNSQASTKPGRLRATADGKPPPFQPATKAEVDKRLKSLAAGHPFAEASCLPGGVPQMMQPPAGRPLEIVEASGQVTILFGSLTVFRIIRMNDKHPDDPDPTFMGDAVGHWEGDTLVVDTIGLKDTTTIDGVIPHTEDLHLVERFRRTGPHTLEDLTTIEDPMEFTKPYTYRFVFKQEPGGKVREALCAAKTPVQGAKP